MNLRKRKAVVLSSSLEHSSRCSSEDYSSMSVPSKRKAHVPGVSSSSSSSTSSSFLPIPSSRSHSLAPPMEKRPRQESSSPPEDPTNTKEEERKVTTPRQIMPASPTTDWSLAYPKVHFPYLIIVSIGDEFAGIEING